MRAIPSSLPLPSLMSLVLLVLLALSPALCFNLHLDSFNKQTRVTQVQTQMQTQMQTQVQTQEEWRLKLNVPKVQVLAALSLSLSLCPFPAQADIGDILNAAARNSEISYSSNARNMGRLGAGDASGGSLYTSTSPAAQKRRAVAGCKASGAIVREAGVGSEKECLQGIMGGDKGLIDKVNSVLQSRACETCPQGFRKD